VEVEAQCRVEIQIIPKASIAPRTRRLSEGQRIADSRSLNVDMFVSFHLISCVVSPSTGR
jgi:hypothetical protein